ncbi:MAG TPA: 1-pyrroline-5-carboxylate dehydrogenase, partial [Gemmatimonadetes bacterium]|nr:1-pyrroline-5-carboxylate dehydrogenase [Gemmatimonadota bacterium]
MNGAPPIPPPVNEPILTYASGTFERAELKTELEAQSATVVDIPLVIGGEEIRTGNTSNVVMPHLHSHILATFHKAGKEEIGQAVSAAAEAHHEWSTTRWEDRAGVFLRAADLLAGPWRQKLNAATMLGQSKTAFQAEIDSACE